MQSSTLRNQSVCSSPRPTRRTTASSTLESGRTYHQYPRLLGVILDRQLNFKGHQDKVIARGTKSANFLSSLSNTKWGIPPHLFKTLITATVHAATDYAVAAWMNLSVPQYFSEKLTTIDNICSTRALGALRNSPDVFLRHDLDMQTPRNQAVGKDSKRGRADREKSPPPPTPPRLLPRTAYLTNGTQGPPPCLLPITSS